MSEADDTLEQMACDGAHPGAEILRLRARVAELEAEVEKLHGLVKYRMVVTTLVPGTGQPRQHMHKGRGVYDPPLPDQRGGVEPEPDDILDMSEPELRQYCADNGMDYDELARRGQRVRSRPISLAMLPSWRWV